MILVGTIAAIAGMYAAWGVRNQIQHRKSMQQFEHRIHVNGIRGKSSVTRLVAATLREGGIKTAANNRYSRAHCYRPP